MCVDCHAQLTLQAAGWPPDLQRGEGPEEVALLQKLLNKTNDTEEQRENAVRALHTYSLSTAFCSNATTHSALSISTDAIFLITNTTTLSANGET